MTISGASAAHSSQGRTGVAPLVVATLFLGLVAGAVAGDLLPRIVLGFYVVAGFVTYFAYAWDKAAARKNRWRTQENTLHLFSLLGGWPGALFTRRILRHKSRKRPFLIAFWITVLLNCGALIWMLTNLENQLAW